MKDIITEELFETIEQYLLGELDAAAKAEFEKQIGEDESLAGQVEEFRILFAGAEEAVLKARLDVYHESIKDEKKPETKVRAFPIFRYMIAASVALLICLGGWWFFNQSSPSEQLFTKFFEPDPGLPTTMGVNEAYEFNRGMVDYKSGSFQAAITKWEPLFRQYSGNDTLGFFLGVSYLAIGNSGKAIPYLETAIDKPGSAFRNEALWYQGLSYLREDNISEAKKLIEASDHPKKAALLSDLK